MKIRHFLMPLLWLLALAANAQPAQWPQEVPERVSAPYSPTELARSLDSASLAAFMIFHARYLEASPHLEPLQKGKDYYWQLRTPSLGVKAYLQLEVHHRDTLYIYDAQRKMVEKVHQGNLFQKIWVSQVYEEGMYLRYRNNSGQPLQLTIDGYSLQLLPPGRSKKSDFGDSDFCEINVNCDEGEDFRNVQQSVVRINIKLGGFTGWCTGSLVNTTDFSFKPYIITAEHCGIAPSNQFVNTADLNRWEFFFDYETNDCSTPPNAASIPIRKLVGAALLARSDDNGGDFGSDFMLLNLNDKTGFDQLNRPYFAGWDHSDTPPTRGVSIHHPQGDIKKISTFKSTPVSSEFGSSVSDTHWEVRWSSTTNGLGVTEPGSSGCPLINSSGLITGMLTGGLAICSSPGDPDYFGKFSYSWDRNGNTDERRLKPWLDPINQNPIALSGAFRGEPNPIDTNIFSVVPVPVYEGLISVKGLGVQKTLVQLQIFSAAGQLVYLDEIAPVANEVFEIEVSGFRNGIYFMRIKRDEGSEIFKFNIINQP